MSALSDQLNALASLFETSFTGISEDIKTLIENQNPTTDPDVLAAIARMQDVANKFTALDAENPATPPVV